METSRAEIDSCMSPPSPDFSLDSSSPFANGLHFESILFEDEDEEEAVEAMASNTDSKTKLDVKLCPTRRKKSKNRDVNFEDKSDGGLSSFVSRPAGIRTASSGSVHSFPSCPSSLCI